MRSISDQKNRRTAPTVQDVINGTSGKPRPKHKSGYTGPKKAPQTVNIPARNAEPDLDAVGATVTYRSGGILDYAWIAYAVILAIALACAITAYMRTGHDGIYYPYNSLNITGVVRDIFDDYKTGGLGHNHKTKAGEESLTEEETSALLGETATTTAPNSTTGATMALDVGDSYGSYKPATSYEELLGELDTALAANDPNFVGIKLSYEDPESKALIGYPQSVIEHFTKYMADNSDKRANFLAEIKDEATFSVKNGEAYLVKLPLLQFTINMGYDGTTISISGFSDQKMDSGQSAVVSPLLPCMYTIHAETAKGSQTSEVECNMNEGNLKINIGVTN